MKSRAFDNKRLNTFKKEVDTTSSKAPYKFASEDSRRLQAQQLNPDIDTAAPRSPLEQRRAMKQRQSFALGEHQPEVVRRVEESTGQRLGAVDVQTDPGVAGELARTKGSTIQLSPDVEPGSPQGQKVLTHEATHILQQQLPQTKKQTNPKAQHAAAEVEAAQATEAALGGRSYQLREWADPGKSYAFTELVKAQKDLWDTSVETLKASLPGFGEEKSDTKLGADVGAEASGESSATALDEEPQTAEPEAKTVDDGQAMDSASQEASSALEAATQERSVKAAKGGNKAAEGEEGSEEGGGGQAEVKQAQSAIASAVERAYGGAAPESSAGDAPQVNADTSSADAALSAFVQTAQNTLKGAAAEVDIEQGENDLKPATDPMGDVKGELEVETPEFDAETILDQERAERILGEDTLGLGLEALVLVKDEELEAFLEGDVATAPQEHQASIETRREEGIEQLEAKRKEAQEGEKRQVEAARTMVDREREAWRGAQRSLVDEKRALAEGFTQEKITEAQSHQQEANSQVVSIYADAESKAEQIGSDAERKADAKKSESKQEEQSWLEAGIEWVQEKANAVVESVHSIFEAARSAVTSLLEKARGLASQVIDAATSFIQSCLDAVQEHLDGLVALLPEQLRVVAEEYLDRLHTIIDDAQKELDGWAEALKSSVDALLEELTGALQELLTTLEGSIVSAVEGLNALLDQDVMAWLAAEFPLIAQLLDEGFDRVMEKIGTAASEALAPVFEALGLDELAETFQEAVDAAGSGDLLGALTGCCECFGRVLDGLLNNFQEMLDSDWAESFRESVEQGNADEDKETLDMLVDVFALIKEWGEPVYDFIVQVGQAIDAAMLVLGVLGDVLWQQIAKALGLDPSLPPLEAIKKKIEELWDKVVAELQPLIDAVSEFWRWLKEDSFLAPVFELIAKIPEAIEAIRQLWDFVLREGKEWLAKIEQAVLEGVAAVVELVSTLATKAWEGLKSFMAGLLERLGLMEAWKSTVAFFQSVMATIASVIATVKTVLADVMARLDEAWNAFVKVLAWLGEQALKLVDFVVGFSLAVSALITLNPIPMIAFLAGNAWLMLSECYQAELIGFIIDLFIAFVEATPMPAEFDALGNVIRTAALSFLNTLKNTAMDEKVQALNIIARLMAGRAAVEFMAGFVVGLLKGVWDSTIGTLVFLGQAIVWLGKLVVPGGGGSEEDGKEAEEGEREESEEAEDGEREEAEDGQHDDGAQEHEEGDVGSDDPPPAAPGDLLNWEILLEKVFKEGVTVDDLKVLLEAFNTSLEEVATQMGAKGAESLMSAFKNASGAMYAVGEGLGMVVGIIVTEIVIAFLAGLAAGPSGGGSVAALLGKWGLLIAKHLPKVYRALKALKVFLKPLLTLFTKLKGQIAKWATKVMAWLDNLIKWVGKQLRKLKPKKKPKGKKPKKGKKDDKSPLKAKAKKAAAAALKEAKAKASTKVVSKKDLETIIAPVAKKFAKGKIKIKLDVEAKTTPKTWDFKATASEGSKKKNHTSTGGWLALDKKTPYFTAKDQTDNHKKIIANADNSLEEEAQKIAKETPGLKEIHAKLKAKIKSVEQNPTPKLLEGIKFNIEEEKFKKGKDKRGEEALIYRWTIVPNADDDEIVISVNKKNDDVGKPTDTQIDLYFANYLALEKPDVAGMVRYDAFKAKVNGGDVYDLQSNAWKKLQDLYDLYVEKLDESATPLTGDEFTDALYGGKSVDSAGALKPTSNWETSAKWPLEYVKVLYGAPGLARLFCSPAQEPELALHLEQHLSDFSPLVGSDATKLKGLIFYVKKEFKKLAERTQNLIEFNAIAPAKQHALNPLKSTDVDSDYVAQYKALSGTEKAALDSYAGTAESIEKLRQLLLDKCKGLKDSALKAGMAIVGTLHTKSKTINVKNVEGLAKAYDNHSPGSGALGAIPWGAGQEGSASANIKKHFEKHACNQHGNLDFGEPYQWMQTIGYTIEKAWLQGMVTAGKASLSSTEENQLFGTGNTIANSTQALYFFGTYINANLDLVEELRTLHEGSYQQAVITGVTSATPGYICFGSKSPYFAAFNGSMYIVGRVFGGLNISSGYFLSNPGSRLSQVVNDQLWTT